ncbi:MAG: DHA2 family efflux MFS transporter permease subunit [Parcubacteria group bacterium]|jgi:DHA2 family multidrug resistance protein
MNEKTKSNLRWWILLTVIIGTFLGRLDQTIVGLALPKIIDEFGITVTSAGWISTAYILANAVFVPIWGKLGDTIGQKRVYILGFSLFIGGSILAGAAWNLGSMIVFRVIQAIAGSADYPTAMAILAITFPGGKERAQAMGIWSSAFAASAVFGPLIGGPIIDNFGWRWVFYINLPIGVIGLLMALIFIGESKKEESFAGFDWYGALALGASLTSLVLVLDKGLDWGWLSGYSLLCYLGTILFMAIFIMIEKRQLNPIVDLNFFKNSVFVSVIANNFIVFLSMMGAIFLIPIFAQIYLGLDATQTGYLFMPMAGALLLAAPLGAALTGRVKSNYVIMASTFVAAFGLFLFTFLDPRSGSLNIMIPMGIMAFGMGFGMSQRTSIIASAVPIQEIGSASSVLALARNISGAFGIAIFGTILQNATYSYMSQTVQNSILNIHTPQNVQTFVALMILKSQVLAYDRVFLIASITLFIGAIGAYWIKVKEEVKAEVYVE